jgi:hypothetical protein
LPTSLTYIVLQLEAVHLGDLLRISVRSGTKFTPSPQDFQGPTQAHRTPREARCFTGTTALSPAKPIPGLTSLTKKRELFPGLAPTSPGSFALPHSTPKGLSPCSGSGILTRFPFDRNGHACCVQRVSHRQTTSPRFRTEFSYHLGSTDPCSTAVHMEPFSTSVFKVLV